MNYLKRTIRYLKLHLGNPRYLFTYAINYFNPNFIPDIKYYELDELEDVLRAGKSLVRIGDGEVYIMNNGNIGYQKFEPKLKEVFFKIISEYDESSSCVIGLNKTPISKSNSTLRKDKLLNCWMPMKSFYEIYFNKKAKYFDATLFYYNETFPEYFEAFLKTRHLVLVTRQHSIEKFKANKSIPFSDVSFVETPENNAFDQYDQIKKEVLDEVARHGKSKTIVLAAFGPASKLLVYELAKEGVVSIDVGRGIEVAYTDERIDHIIYPDLN
ncbi:MAG: DUF1792 domain-containing protein [Candidatus Nomurabacteria bacterium]|nr:DUF1792 domain-containing protein [Candidatus Nomurabacteria bacterium]USN88128.1 MAG: DUF1792 domain-containing protein [Candidatus Nomurabacteria bacterium]